MEPASKVAEDAAKALGLTQLVPTIYQDLLQPAAREAGQKLVVVAKAVSIALAPLEMGVWGYDQIKNFLAASVAAKLAQKPPEEIKPADKHIAGPIVMALAFASDAPQLREMYANLLAAAMYSPAATRVHPSFVQIIQQLTPSEAKLLRAIAQEYKNGSVLFREHVAELSEGKRISSVAELLLSERTPSSDISEQWKQFCSRHEVADPEPIDAFFMNFLRLGILSQNLEPSSETQLPLSSWYEQRRLERCVQLTEYGDLFLSVCVRELK